mmetsp:Transcript_110109/g.350813  ORF Transcript_110109/g.350813 Transcript_110109/m.350813 type:complete len:217 (-) Transcript_110109:1212-1862(-)
MTIHVLPAPLWGSSRTATNRRWCRTRCKLFCRVDGAAATQFEVQLFEPSVTLRFSLFLFARKPSTLQGKSLEFVQLLAKASQSPQFLPQNLECLTSFKVSSFVHAPAGRPTATLGRHHHQLGPRPFAWAWQSRQECRRQRHCTDNQRLPIEASGTAAGSNNIGNKATSLNRHFGVTRISKLRQSAAYLPQLTQNLCLHILDLRRGRKPAAQHTLAE